MTLRIRNKKNIIIFVCAAAALIVAATVLIIHFSSPDITSLADAGISAENVTLISHRGMNVLAPENSLEAAQETARYGYTHIEFDIRQTKDGVWILMHDEDIDHTTNGKGKVSELTYKQLFEYRIDKSNRKGEKPLIPTLGEMLAQCGKLGLHPVIEIKQNGTDFIEPLINYIGYRTGECTIITFDREQAQMISDLLKSGNTVLSATGAEVYWLTSNLSDETLEKANSDISIGVSFNGNEAGTEEEIKKFTQAGIKLATWTIDKPERLAELHALGISTFTTNSITPNGIIPDSTDEVTENERQ